MKTYRAAIVGLGRMGSTIDEEVQHYPAIALPYSVAGACKASQRLELVAGADVLPEKRQAFARRWGVQAVYEDFRQMIRQEAPELVAICTRAENHAELALGVAEEGVGMVFLEKAMACSMRQADALLRVYRERRIGLNTGVLRRFDARYHRMRAWIAEGRLGIPRAAVHYAASSLMHGHIHSIDTLMYLLGDPRPRRVRGELERGAVCRDNRFAEDPKATYRIEFEGGVEGWSLAVGQWDFEVFGSEGSIKGMNNGMDWAVRRPVRLDEKHTIFHQEPLENAPPQSATLYCLEDLVRAKEEGRPTLGNVEVAHRATEACLAVAQSHLEGGAWVELPLANRDLYVWHV
jgi:predicted dehydrogenase